MKTKVLIVEDDRDIAELIQYNLTKEGYTAAWADNGEKGFKAAKTSLPDLILLDLNMPGLGGREFLRLVKSDSVLDTIPIVILTTSEADKDILESFRLQAAGYIKKPVAIADFQEVIQTLSDYWFTVCKRITHEPNKQDTKCFTC